jgi:K+/H+ antiporter YhaU regulatory subunit KhtT
MITFNPSVQPINSKTATATNTRWYEVDSVEIAGKTISELNIRRLTGATILAIERAGMTVAHPDPEFPLAPGDRLHVTGTCAQLGCFERVFALSRFFTASELRSANRLHKLA